MAEKISFIGLGLMGYPMAGHLASAGHRVRVYNRTRSKAESWVAEHGGALAATPAQAAEGADFVFACVGNDDDVRQVTLGEAGAFRALGAGAVFVDHTTDSAILARQLEAAARRGGFGFLDAPVSGGQSGAEQGVLSVMVGGDRAAFEKARPLIDCYARIVKRLGPAGSGQLAKMVNQICIAGLVQGLSEGLHFARAAGLDPKAVVEVISKGAAQSWQMDNRHETMRRCSRGASTSASPSSGCARTSRWPSRKRAATARTCPWRRSWTSSTPRCSPWVATAGTPRASLRGSRPCRAAAERRAASRPGRPAAGLADWTLNRTAVAR
jgi:3-hydroxyisobutyrate dehydrogenase